MFWLFLESEEDESAFPPWRGGPWKDLLPELLGKIAGGRDELKEMRGACRDWKTAFEATVTAIRVVEDSEVMTCRMRISERFPLLSRYIVVT